MSRICAATSADPGYTFIAFRRGVALSRHLATTVGAPPILIVQRLSEQVQDVMLG